MPISEAAVFRSDVAGLPMSGASDAHRATRWIRRLADLIAVREPSALLPELSGIWREALGAEAVLLLLQVSPDKPLAALARNGDPPRLLDGDAATDEAALNSEPERQATVIPLLRDSATLGRAVVVYEPSRKPPMDVAAALAHFTVRLADVARNLGGASDVADLERAKLESLAEFAAGAGHEINNPLATISGRVQLLLKEERDPERRRALETIGGQALRIRDMIGDVMLFARPPRPKLERIDLAHVVRSVLDQLRDVASKAGCTFETNVDSAVPILADRAQVAVVVDALVRNSIEALTGRGGTVQVHVESSNDSTAPFAILSVEDHGPGLSASDREHLFDPFYSGRQAGRGLGFGLSKCWRIVTNHGGRIEVASAPNERTVFRVYWPADSGPR